MEFISKDPEQVLRDTIALYQTKAGVVLNDADVERIMIDCIAYREVLLRNGMEWLMRQNFVQLAEGDNLDYWGQLFGVLRITGESDDSYRIRILEANKAVGIGTKAAYKARILSLAEVADVIIFSNNDDNSLTPGRVRLIPIKKEIQSGTMLYHGVVHDNYLQNIILDAICTDDFGVIGHVFVFSAAQPVLINGAIEARAIIGYDHQQLYDNIDFQLNRYFGELSQSFDSEFGLTAVTEYLSGAAGLQQIVNMSFPNVPVLQSGQFYQRGIVTINIE